MAAEESISESAPTAPDRRPSARLKAFLANPFLNLSKAVLLLLIGLSEASATLSEDVQERRLRVGHGLVLIGFFGILDAVPHLLEAHEAGIRYGEWRRAARLKTTSAVESRGPDKERGQR